MRELLLFLSGSITAILVPAVTELVKDWVHTRRAEADDLDQRRRADVTALLDITQEIYGRVLKESALPKRERDLTAIMSEFLPRFSRLEAMIDDPDLHATMYEVRECLVGWLMLDTNDPRVSEQAAYNAHAKVIAAQRQMHQILNRPLQVSRTDLFGFLAARLPTVLTIVALLALAALGVAIALFDGVTVLTALFFGVAIGFGIVIGSVLTVAISRRRQQRMPAAVTTGGDTAVGTAE